MKNKQFIFLMCSERSGSNLISYLLNAHSKICAPPVKHIFSALLMNVFRYGDLNNYSQWESLVRDAHGLLTCGFSEWETTLEVKDILRLVKPGRYIDLLKLVYAHEANYYNKNTILVKENKIYTFITSLLLNFPQAHYIYQVRDPRDMALSWRSSPIHRGGIIAAAKQWKQDQQHFMSICEALRSKTKVAQLKYECLLQNSGETLSGLLNVLGYQYENDILNFHQQKACQKNSSKLSAWQNLSKPINKNNAQKFKHELTQEEISYIEYICQHEMRHLGYELCSSATQIKSITEEHLAKFNLLELNNERSDIPMHVKENILKKKVFYTKPKPSSTLQPNVVEI